MDLQIRRKLLAQSYFDVQKKLMEWDPIGGGVPDDEYAAYAGPIVSMLERKTEKEEMMKYLKEVSEETISVPNPTDRAEKVIDDLIEWWPIRMKEIEEES